MYECDEGGDLRRKWYRQLDETGKNEWTEIAHQDYFNHRHTCRHGCRDIMLYPIGNVPIMVQMSEKAEVSA